MGEASGTTSAPAVPAIPYALRIRMTIEQTFHRV